MRKRERKKRKEGEKKIARTLYIVVLKGATERKVKYR
jgi:hypothetical protein